MTRKDYDVIAACIGAALADTRNDKNTVHDVATRLTLELKLKNDRFDAGKFFTRVEYWRKRHGGVQ